MSPPTAGRPDRHDPDGVAFLLAQLGAHAADRFGARIAQHDLSPPQAGMMRLLVAAPGLSQQQLADRLGLLPSQVVSFVDELEADGLVQRVKDAADRRRNTVRLTPAGRLALGKIGRAAREHEQETCSGLSAAERQQLRALLTKLANAQGLTPGVHPGYRRLRRLR